MDTAGTDAAVDMCAVPRVVAGMDATSQQLSPQEGFILSRVDGHATLEQIIHASGLNHAQAMESLQELARKGLLTWDGASGGQDREAGEEPGEPWQNMSFDPFELSEECDLDQDMRKKILYLHKNMEEMTHYRMLEVDRRAETKDIKRAYFKVSRVYHPDSYFRKNLGSFKSKIEALFKRVGRAYEVLSDPQKRKAYDATLPYEPTPEELEEKHKKEEQKERDERLAAERRRRLLRRSPLAARRAKARRHYKDALAMKEEGDTVKAANSIKLALALEPDNQEYKAFLDEVGPDAAKIRAEKEYRRGQAEEAVGKYEDALQAYLVAIENCPDESRALARAAALLLELKRDLRQALEFSRRAQFLDPDEPKHSLTTANIYEAMEMWLNAQRELKRYVTSNPLDEKAAERLKQLGKKVK